jgi:hypothetical protein
MRDAVWRLHARYFWLLLCRFKNWNKHCIMIRLHIPDLLYTIMLMPWSMSHVIFIKNLPFFWKHSYGQVQYLICNDYLKTVPRKFLTHNKIIYLSVFFAIFDGVTRSSESLEDLRKYDENLSWNCCLKRAEFFWCSICQHLYFIFSAGITQYFLQKKYSSCIIIFI